jgi:holo-[acyl-carrier protein] synthase
MARIVAVIGPFVEGQGRLSFRPFRTKVRFHMPQAVVGIGVDLVDVARVRQARFFERAMDFVLTPTEQAACRAAGDPVQFFASRFAMKEAVIKATPAPVTYLDLETSKQGAAPIINYLNAACRSAFRARVSLSHVPDYAVGIATVEHLVTT